MDKSLKKFMDMSTNFATKTNLEEYTAYARELLEGKTNVTIVAQAGEVLELAVKNERLDLEFFADITLHRSRMQVRTRNFRGGTQISHQDTFIYRDQTDRRGLELFQIFSRLDSLAV